MKKKLLKGIAVFTLFSAISFSVIGCSEPADKDSQTPPVSQDNSVEGKIRIVEDGAEIGPGPLTKENVSLAGIHIGDSQEQVLELYGEPDKKEQIHSTPFPGWYYDDLGLLVMFYRRGEQEPVEGVVDIRVSGPSKLATDTGIGLGDSLESIVNNYDEAYGRKRQGAYRSIFISGVNKYESELPGSKEKIILYYPSLSFSLEHNKTTMIILSNQQLRP